jgi:microcystin-dependent protein
MAALWPLSRTKEYDINGDPIVGAQASFYNVGTTTPQTVYADASLSDAYSTDNPVSTDGYGRWPAVFLDADPGAYRVRVVDDDDVLLFDDDDIDVPLASAYTPPDAGDTAVELLFRVGMLQDYYGTSAPSGWLRCNAKTLGSATSGATERANADCEALFLHLWGVDSTLAVSGGRGANAAADWASNKTITLPDLRDRARIGLGDMGSTDAGRIADALTDGPETNTTLGATVGTSTVALSIAGMPVHNHAATFAGNALPSHDHDIVTRDDIDHAEGGRVSNTSSTVGDRNIETEGASAGTPSGTVTVANRGDGEAHLNVQPSMFVTVLIKL